PPPLHHPPTPHIHTLSLHDALPIFGYGLEGALTDATTKRIIDEEITPKFKSGDFAGGISAGVNRMLRVVDGEKLPAPEPEHWQRSEEHTSELQSPCNLVCRLLLEKK